MWLLILRGHVVRSPLWERLSTKSSVILKNLLSHNLQPVIQDQLFNHQLQYHLLDRIIFINFTLIWYYSFRVVVKSTYICFWTSLKNLILIKLLDNIGSFGLISTLQIEDTLYNSMLVCKFESKYSFMHIYIKFGCRTKFDIASFAKAVLYQLMRTAANNCVQKISLINFIKLNIK